MSKISWFKSLWLSSKEREILEEAYKKEEDIQRFGIPSDAPSKPVNTYEETEKKIEEMVPTKPYKNIFYSNGIVTVVFSDGDVFSTPVGNKIPQLVARLETKQAILDFLNPKPEVALEEPVVVAPEVEQEN